MREKIQNFLKNLPVFGSLVLLAGLVAMGWRPARGRLLARNLIAREAPMGYTLYLSRSEHGCGLRFSAEAEVPEESGYTRNMLFASISSQGGGPQEESEAAEITSSQAEPNPDGAGPSSDGARQRIPRKQPGDEPLGTGKLSAVLEAAFHFSDDRNRLRLEAAEKKRLRNEVEIEEARKRFKDNQEAHDTLKAEVEKKRAEQLATRVARQTSQTEEPAINPEPTEEPAIKPEPTEEPDIKPEPSA